MNFKLSVMIEEQHFFYYMQVMSDKLMLNFSRRVCFCNFIYSKNKPIRPHVSMVKMKKSPMFDETENKRSYANKFHI